MDRSHHKYQSYTLRLSRVADTDTWRATLYCAQDGKRHYFGGLAELYAFLQHTTCDSDAKPDAQEAPSEL